VALQERDRMGGLIREGQKGWPYKGMDRRSGLIREELLYLFTSCLIDLTLYWLPVCHFRCKEFNPLVIWIWNQNIAISTIVGNSSHIY
jgi:hypothetical protein